MSVTRADGKVVGVGTPRYAAPEQFNGGAVSPETDIHALGMLANECFGGRPPRAWERIVVCPDQCVTIEGLDKVNLLVYSVFEGSGVASYFDRFGFFNGMHGPTSAQLELFRDVKHVLESSDSPDLSQLAMRLSDALVTYAHDLRVGANAVVVDAIRQIRENLKNGIVRLTPLYEQLHIGHTALGRAFRQTGSGRPAEYIRQEQLRVVKRLLKTTRKPIAAIAREAGFISIAHFANFIKRNTGMTARELRRGVKF